MNIISSWDDACYSDCRLAELLKKYDIKAIFFWQNNLMTPFNLNRCKKFLQISDCIQISKNFDVGSHTINHHYLTRIPLEIAKNEIEKSKIYWQNILGKKISWFCYPRAKLNEHIVNIVSKNYTYARVTALINDNKNENKFLIKPNLHVGVARKEYKDIDWYDYGIELIKNMKKNNCQTFHLIGHSWEIDLFDQWDKLEDFFKNIKDLV